METQEQDTEVITTCMFGKNKHFIKIREVIEIHSPNEEIFTFKDGKLHSYNDQPSYQSPVVKQWHKDGELHRENGPAVEYQFGRKIWYLNGDLIRRTHGDIES